MNYDDDDETAADIQREARRDAKRDRPLPVEVYFEELPAEVQARLRWYTSKDAPNIAAMCFKKSDISRGEAWSLVSPLPDNPWRKCHTENYWAWYRPARSMT